MADTKLLLQPREAHRFKIASPPHSERRRPPPAPVRTQSAMNTLGYATSSPKRTHSRHKSTIMASGSTRHIMPSRRPLSVQSPSSNWHRAGQAGPGAEVIPEDDLLSPGDSSLLSPPVTPDKGRQAPDSDKVLDTTTFDFSKLDYELERARVIGEGLWSTVLLADAKYTATERDTIGLPSPPVTPQRKPAAGASSVFAVKTPARKDAKDVFWQEAKVLTHLMSEPGATQYIVPFHGLDVRNSALVFEAVLGGSLENLNSRLQVMTEVARHLELVSLFPGLAEDLVSGLEFIQSAGVVHADIKPANVLLDISEHHSLPRPVIRARYIDFSASFRLNSDDSTKNSGGTWDYMAPEQMRIFDKELSTPSFASDVWGLGITLLSLMVGGSPYSAACGNDVFRTREAIKTGDPLGFARMDPKVQKRMAAVQDFVDCCRLALKKDRTKRVTASAWRAWLQE